MYKYGAKYMKALNEVHNCTNTGTRPKSYETAPGYVECNNNMSCNFCGV